MLVDGLEMTPNSSISAADGDPYHGNAIYDIASFVPGKPKADENLLILPIPRDIRLPTAAAASVANSVVAAAAPVSYSIQRNGTEVGTINFNTGETTGSYNVPIQIDFLVGDILTVVAPATADADQAGLSYNIVCSVL